jgi:shikimate kinase
MIIFLIGFMGSGKSYVGRKLAPIMGYDHIDSDRWLEEREGIPVKNIFEEKGETYFRELEKKFIAALTPNQNLIVSTGGGIPCFYDNMEQMNQKGLTIYLNRSKTSNIAQLLKGIHRRPHLSGMGEEEVSEFYDKKMVERKSYYEQSKLKVGDANVEEIHKIIMEHLSI